MTRLTALPVEADLKKTSRPSIRGSQGAVRRPHEPGNVVLPFDGWRGATGKVPVSRALLGLALGLFPKVIEGVRVELAQRGPLPLGRQLGVAEAIAEPSQRPTQG